jgi:hypothetical protein
VVEASALVGVVLAAVELDDEAVLLLLVAVATAPAAVRLGEPRLFAGGREPVSLLADRDQDAEL